MKYEIANKKFLKKTCLPMKSILKLLYSPTQEVCKSMTNHAVDDETLLMSVFRGLSVYFNYTGSAECLNVSSAYSEDMMTGWSYQVNPRDTRNYYMLNKQNPNNNKTKNKNIITRILSWYVNKRHKY